MSGREWKTRDISCLSRSAGDFRRVLFHFSVGQYPTYLYVLLKLFFGPPTGKKNGISVITHVSRFPSYAVSSFYIRQQLRRVKSYIFLTLAQPRKHYFSSPTLFSRRNNKKYRNNSVLYSVRTSLRNVFLTCLTRPFLKIYSA